MINKLIEKYKEKLKYITDLKNKTVSCLEKEFIVKEIIKDLEELKQFLELEIEGVNDNYEDMEFNDMTTIKLLKEIIGGE